MNKKGKYIILYFLLFISTLNYAQDLETVRLEIKETTLKEQLAFKIGNCDEVLSLMEDEITFLANGKKVPSKAVVGKFCNSISRPFKTPTIDRLDIYPLSETTGYTIKTLEYAFDDKTMMQEYVTKIWRKTDNIWKISHLHSTIKKVSILNQAKE